MSLRVHTRRELPRSKLDTIERNLKIQRTFFGQQLQEKNISGEPWSNTLQLLTSATTKNSENLANPTTWSKSFFFLVKKACPSTRARGLSP